MFIQMNGTRFVFAVTLFGGVFVVICIYFDRQRHKDPYFRKKLQLKRAKAQLLKKSAPCVEVRRNIQGARDQEMIILQEIKVAERLMGQNRFDKAIVHFANAIGVCVDPCNLLLALRHTLPPDAFELLIQVLVSNYGQRFSRFQDDTRLKTILQTQATARY